MEILYLMMWTNVAIRQRATRVDMKVVPEGQKGHGNGME